MDGWPAAPGAGRWGLALQVILLTGYLFSFIVRYDDPQPPLIGSIIGAP